MVGVLNVWVVGRMRAGIIGEFGFQGKNYIGRILIGLFTERRFFRVFILRYLVVLLSTVPILSI